MAENASIVNLQEYAKRVIAFIKPMEIILFGSHAKGTARPESDIDIAIVVEQITGNVLEIETELFKLCRDVDDSIEPVLFVHGHDPSGFLAHVRDTGQVIYTRA